MALLIVISAFLFIHHTVTRVATNAGLGESGEKPEKWYRTYTNTTFSHSRLNREVYFAKYQDDLAARLFRLC